MPNDTQKDPRRNFVPLLLPWLLGAAMLIVYWFTLNRWINLSNVGQVAQISGQTWQPQAFGPLTWLATLPLQWVSLATLPMALNLFSALCAAIVLALLARCVAILPQDRSEPQRLREKSDFAFLTGWQAYFPPMLAVLMLGLQLTFWQNATSFTGAMVSLVVFAAIVWQLLEYRLDESDWRLAVAAVLLGAGMAEDSVFVCFAPVFLAAIIWLKKLEFFHVRFLIRMALFWLAGLAFIFLLPIVAISTADFNLGFWEALKPNIRADWLAVKSFKTIKISLAQAALSSLLPILLMSLRWSASFGDNSRMGTVLASNMFHFVNAAVFTVCVWVMFDSPFSPQNLLNSPALPLSFMTALSIGYALGYFLLVFTRKPEPTRRNPRPASVFPKPLMWLCPFIVGGTFICAVVCVVALAHKNHPIIKHVNDSTLLKFSQLTSENLPKPGAVLLTDPDPMWQAQTPLRSTLIQTVLARSGPTKNYPILDTQSLNWAPYHRFIHRNFPDQIPSIINDTNMGGVPHIEVLGMIGNIGRSNALAYLHPSYGTIFEDFYPEPHGLTYNMRSLPKDTLLPAPLTKNLIEENEAFWDRAIAELGPSVDKALNDAKNNAYEGNSPLNWVLMRLHARRTANQNALLVGIYCSRSLVDWGVRLQRAGELEKAAKRFQDAKRFNPENLVADINLDFNQTLRSGKPLELNPSRVSADNYGNFRNWNSLVTVNGPIDEISFNFVTGLVFVENGCLRQAAEQFTRVVQLMPDMLAVRYKIAQIYLFNRLPDRALEVIRPAIDTPAKYGINETNSTGLNILIASANFQKGDDAKAIRLIEKEVALHPDDEGLLITATQSFMNRGLYTNALHIIDAKLARTPEDLSWQFSKGFTSIMVGAYEDSVKAMTKVLAVQTNDPSARFNRALANFQLNKLDQARADYKVLQTEYTNNFQVAYGLGEIAWRKNEKPEALRNFEIYLENAPTNAPEYIGIRDRVKQLGGK